MNIRTLETFVWIARLGSFRAAAKRLYASQPSVSARIAGLEAGDANLLRQALLIAAAMGPRC